MAYQKKQQKIKKGIVRCKYALNFRKKADIEAETLPEGPIPNGTEIDILNKRGAWCRVSYKGKYGYAMAEFIDILEQEDK